MTGYLGRLLRRRGSTILRAADALLLSFLATLIAAIVLGQVPKSISIQVSGLVGLVISSAVLLGMRLLMGLLVWQAKQPINISRGSYSQLWERLQTPVPQLIEGADQIQILGGTLVDLVRHDATLEALAIAASQGKRIEIVILDPKADILETIAAERAETSKETAEEALDRLRQECKFSIQRLLGNLPRNTVEQGLRLSSAMPHHALQRYGDQFLFTAYTFGRGGSSPSMHLVRSPANKSFCKGLERGFDELWKSGSTKGLRLPASDHRQEAS